MRFNSLIYWLFLLAAVVVLRFLPERAKRPWLLFASYVFYASWHYPYLLLLVGSAAFNHYAARWIAAADDRKSRGAVTLAANLVLLALFKYLDWLVLNLNFGLGLLGRAPLELPGWVLPLGISFYLFQCMSYIVDLVRKRETLHGFWDFQLYITYFPQLIAGPIMRAKEFLPQLEKRLHASAADLRAGFGFIISGLVIKIVFADGLAQNVDAAFGRAPSTLSFADVWIMAMAFGLQVYFDFSGYSRIAIGSARLCGITLVDNFNEPYHALTPADFWNRWHMSLSRWIRDYLFYPLVGKKAQLPAMARAAIISMTLCGVWHGAGWTFVAWGVFHGFLLAGHHALALRRRKRGLRGISASDPVLRRLLATGLTFSFVTLGWIFFRAQNVEQAFVLVGKALTPWARSGRALSGMFYLHVVVLMLGVWAMPLIRRVVARGRERLDNHPVTWAACEGAVVGLAIVVCLVYLKGQKAFIYFQF